MVAQLRKGPCKQICQVTVHRTWFMMYTTLNGMQQLGDKFILFLSWRIAPALMCATVAAIHGGFSILSSSNQDENNIQQMLFNVCVLHCIAD